MRSPLSIVAVVLTALSMSANAQTITKRIQELKDLYPQYVAFDTKDAPQFIRGSVVVENAKSKLENQFGMLINSLTDARGFVHYRYQQSIQNIPVEDAIYVVHVKAGKILSENGRWIKNTPSALPTAASLPEAAALQKALLAVKATVYQWQDAAQESFIKNETGNPSATYLPKGTLVYYSGGDEVTSQSLRLAYKFDVYAKEPLSRQYVFVDARNGDILGTKEIIHTVNGTAVTGYSNNRTIQTTKQGAKYVLQDKTRGAGIVTLNLKKGTDYSVATNFTDADNYWNNANANKDQYATDAHWGAEMTYDFYKNNFNRNSIDDNGFAIKSYVHYSRNYFNAFWDGEKMTYGDGDQSDNNLPLTSLDVCGHEITHGLTSFTANLNYKNESGALNEGFSDIFGTCIEFFARPENANWLIGGDFEAIRDMSNPNAFSQPDTYKGKYWAKGLLAALDNGGVHTNSGILNFWFYLLSQGGSGKNDNNVNYNVSGIGIDAAQSIAYRTLTTYLVPTSVYQDARIYSALAATDLFGEGSNEVKQVNNAWDAVGVMASQNLTADHASLIVSSKNSLSAPVVITKQYPNPVKNAFTLEFANDKQGKKTIAVYNLNGGRVYQNVFSVVSGRNVINIQLPILAPGTYIVKMDSEKVSTIEVIR